MTVNVIGQRMNFLVILHGCWLVVILTRRRRAAIARLWPKYCLFLVIFFLYQYLLCVGMPPALCVGKGQGLEEPVLLGSTQPFEWVMEAEGCAWARCPPWVRSSACPPPSPRLSMALEQSPPHQLGAHQVALPA